MSILNYFRRCRDRADSETDELPGAKRSRSTVSPASVSEGESDHDDAGSSGHYTSVTESSDAHSTNTDSTLSSSSSGSNAKQASKFVSDWLIGRQHWLKYENGQGMFCTLCQKYDKSPFSRGTWNTTPCTRIRLQSIISHERAAAHIDCIKLECEKASTKNIHSAINPVIPAKGIEQAFISLYFLAKQRIPHTTNYEPLLDLLGILGKVKNPNSKECSVH